MHRSRGIVIKQKTIVLRPDEEDENKHVPKKAVSKLGEVEMGKEHLLNQWNELLFTNTFQS